MYTTVFAYAMSVHLREGHQTRVRWYTDM